VVELSEHLLDLVFRQKSAIIPELGTFKFVTTSAKMNFGENLLLPPSQTLVFSESTFEQGDLSFLDFLVKEKGFEPYEAGIRIKAYVHQVRNNLKSLNYCYIPGFGTLHLLENEALRFAPGDKIKAIKPTMGLPELTVNPVSREFVRDEHLETEVETTTFIDNRSEKVTSEKNRWAMPALMGFLVLGLILIGYYFYISEFKNKDSESTLPVVVLNEDSILLAQGGFVPDSTLVVDSVADKAAMVKEMDNSYEPENTITPEPTKEVKKTEKVAVVAEETKISATEEASVKTSGKQCAVIVGAMGNPANAKKLEKTVKKSGYTPFSYKSKGLTKVGAACNCDSESIESTLDAMKKINASAWVYESE